MAAAASGATVAATMVTRVNEAAGDNLRIPLASFYHKAGDRRP
jgi:hypothetical protein